MFTLTSTLNLLWHIENELMVEVFWVDVVSKLSQIRGGLASLRRYLGVVDGCEEILEKTNFHEISYLRQT